MVVVSDLSKNIGGSTDLAKKGRDRWICIPLFTPSLQVRMVCHDLTNFGRSGQIFKRIADKICPGYNLEKIVEINKIVFILSIICQKSFKRYTFSAWIVSRACCETRFERIRRLSPQSIRMQQTRQKLSRQNLSSDLVVDKYNFVS